MKEFTLYVASGEADTLALCNTYGLHFHSSNKLALAERFKGDPLQAVVVADTKEEEAGWFISIIVLNHDTGTVHQWSSTDGCMDFTIAANEVARLATAPLSEIINTMARYEVIC